MPMVVGVMPRSEAMMAFSTAATMDLSNGLTDNERASGVLMLATWARGVGVP